MVVVLLFITTGCYNYCYSGDNSDLYTVAINSLLWNLGYSTLTERSCDSEIEIMERDSYGRVLFSYTEKSYSGGEIAFSSLLISQKTEDNYVYYYPDYNFISVPKNSSSNEKIVFSNEEIEILKKNNDWNKEIDLKRCVKKEVSNQKKEVPLSEKELDDILSNYKEYDNKIFNYLTRDDYGRFICYGWILTDLKREYLVILLNPDLTYNVETCFYIPNDYYNYQDEFKQFKELNKWNEVD